MRFNMQIIQMNWTNILDNISLRICIVGKFNDEARYIFLNGSSFVLSGFVIMPENYKKQQ